MTAKLTCFKTLLDTAIMLWLSAAMIANSRPSMSRLYDEVVSCSISGELGSPPDKPMMSTPRKANNIPIISKLESRSYNQQY